MSVCVACELLGGWVDIADNYANQVRGDLLEPASRLAYALLGFYWVGRIGLAMFAERGLEAQELVKEVCISILCFGLLTVSSSMWNVMFGALQSMAFGLASEYADPNHVSGAVSAKEKLTDVARVIDGTLDHVLSGGLILWDSADPFYGLLVWVGCGVLVVVYLILEVLIFFDLLWAHASFVMIDVLMPVIIAAAIIPLTRGLAVAAFRLALSTVLQLAAIGVVIGIGTSFITISLKLAELPANEIADDPDSYIMSLDYLKAVMIGVLLIMLRGAFRTVASQLANTISPGSGLTVGGITRGVQRGVQAGIAVGSGSAAVARGTAGLATKAVRLVSR